MVEALWAQSSASPMWRKLKTHIHAEGTSRYGSETITVSLRRCGRRTPDAAYKLMVRHLGNIADELMAGIERGEVPSGTV